MKVAVSSKIPADLVAQVRHLAEAGNRSVSREVAEAIRRHVMLELLSERSVDGAAVARPSHGGHGEER
jgi:predicted transcriptional regulator